MRVLIIDDDLDMCSLLTRFLQRKGFETDSANSGNKGISKFKDAPFDIVLCDFRLGDKEGNEVLKELIAIKPQTIVIIITGYSDIKTAVDVIKSGAFDYITKPLIPDEVLAVKEPRQACRGRAPAPVSLQINPRKRTAKATTASRCSTSRAA